LIIAAGFEVEIKKSWPREGKFSTLDVLFPASCLREFVNPSSPGNLGVSHPELE